MDVSEFLTKCRDCYPSLPSEELVSTVRCRMSGDKDINAAFRNDVLEALNRTLRDEDRRLILYLLDQEVRYHKSLPGGVYESIKLCAYLLFRLGYVEDSLSIWHAKTTNFDTHCGVDVQLLVAAGVEETLAWLKLNDAPEALSAVGWIEACRKTGDFNNPDGYREFAKRYFADERG
jgi:hypothetical protein